MLGGRFFVLDVTRGMQRRKFQYDGHIATLFRLIGMPVPCGDISIAKYEYWLSQNTAARGTWAEKNKRDRYIAQLKKSSLFAYLCNAQKKNYYGSIWNEAMGYDQEILREMAFRRYGGFQLSMS